MLPETDLNRDPNWQSCLRAAERKTKIARYHLKKLRWHHEHPDQHSDPGEPPSLESLPPIPIQAHFEGVVFSVRAAVEQIAKAIKLVRKTDFNKTLRKFASATTNMRLKELAKWFNDHFSKTFELSETVSPTPVMTNSSRIRN